MDGVKVAKELLRVAKEVSREASLRLIVESAGISNVDAVGYGLDIDIALGQAIAFDDLGSMVSEVNKVLQGLTKECMDKTPIKRTKIHGPYVSVKKGRIVAAATISTVWDSAKIKSKYDNRIPTYDEVADVFGIR